MASMTGRQLLDELDKLSSDDLEKPLVISRKNPQGSGYSFVNLGSLEPLTFGDNTIGFWLREEGQA